MLGGSVGSLLGPLIGAVGAFSQGFGNGIVAPGSPGSPGIPSGIPNKVEDEVDPLEPPSLDDPE